MLALHVPHNLTKTVNSYRPGGNEQDHGRTAAMGHGIVAVASACLVCRLCKGQKAATLADNDGFGALGLQHLPEKAKCS